MEDKRYFSKAWSLMTRDRGWIKPLLVMTVASLVPIVGLLGVSGYGLEWARLTAWNIDSSPKQKNVEVGTCIASGWRGFVVSLGWGLCVGLVVGVISGFFSIIPGAFGSLIRVIISLASTAISIFLAPVLEIAQIRAAIYERISAGYRVRGVFEMIKRDGKGFSKLVLINLCTSLITSIASAISLAFVAIPLAPVIYAAATHNNYLMVMSLSQTLVWLVLVLILVIFALTFLCCGVYLVTITATALWMRQFDVASWGRSEDPLPVAAEQVWQAPVHPSEAWSQTTTQAPVDPSPTIEPDMPALASESEAVPEEPVVAPETETDFEGTPDEPQVAPEDEMGPEEMPTEPLAAPEEELAAGQPVVTEEPVSDIQTPTEPAVQQDGEPTIRLNRTTGEDSPAPLDATEEDVDKLYEDLYDVMREGERVQPPSDEE